ncbi:acyltransferase family protein [Corynebacterium resistens]|uniref:acyltransferase family protein n=1 Tax=Corynebacterium resistens TaxID=258224 RepID=UPI001305130F|nr:acyltransferase family protein [Corynebacterium resistens]
MEKAHLDTHPLEAGGRQYGESPRGTSTRRGSLTTVHTPTAQSAQPAGGKRVAWADTAKGFSILAVCLMHVVTLVPGGMETSWGAAKTVLDPLRMPLFFLVSGLFAHRVIERSFPDLWFRRLWFLLVPYVIFTPVVAANRLYIDGKLFSNPPPSITAPSRIPGLPVRLDMHAILTHMDYEAVFKAILFGDPGLWFLYALMLYNIAAWSVRKLPVWLAVALSFTPAYFGSVAGLMSHQGIRQVLTYLPIFFIGLFFRKAIFRLANHAFSLPTILITAGLFIASEVINYALDHSVFAEWDDTIAALTVGTGLLRIFAAIPFGIVFASWLAQTPIVAPVLKAIGRHTLPIYVSHQSALGYGFFLLAAYQAQEAEFVEIFEQPISQIYLGFVICAISGFAFYGLSKVPVLGWVLNPPSLRPKAAQR